MRSQNIFFLVSLLAFYLHRTRGHYRAELMFGLPIFLCLFFLRPLKFLDDKREVILWTLAGLFFGFFLAQQPLVIYGTNRIAYHSLRVLFLMATTLVTWWGVRALRGKPVDENLAQRWFGCIWVLVAGGLFLVPVASPKPWIDIWYVGNEAVTALLSGRNPYAVEYTQLYRGLPGLDYPVFFGYPPLILLWYVPWKLMLGDIRYGFVFCHLVSAWLLFRCARRSAVPPVLSVLFASAFLCFPVSAFIIEQSWIDPFAMMLGVAMLSCFQLSRPLCFVLLLGLFISTKQNYILAAPVFAYLLFKMVSSWGKLFKYSLVALVMVLLINLPFFFWSPQGFIERVLWFASQTRFTANQAFALKVRMDALSLVALAAHWGKEVPKWLPWLAVCVSYGILAYHAIKIKDKRQFPLLFYWMALVFFALFILSPWAFCNYYWFASLGLWLYLAHGPLRQCKSSSAANALTTLELHPS